MDWGLIELETQPADAELIDEIFRAVHTLNGATSFPSFEPVERLTHAGEQLIGDLRSGAPEKVVVEQLTSGLREMGLFSGETVLGNGALALIFDVAASAARAGICKAAELGIIRRNEMRKLTPYLPKFLVFQGRREGFQAKRITPTLQWSKRMSTVPVTSLEWPRGSPNRQCRGLLLALKEHAHCCLPPDLNVLICQMPGLSEYRRLGIIVRQVFDAASGALLPETAAGRRLALVRDQLVVTHDDLTYVHTFQEVA